MSVQVILKNSSVQDKAATAQQLAIGEIALNYHESGPFLQCKDTAGQVWRIGGVVVAPEAPGQPEPGTWWFETDTKGLYFYDGTGWTEITGGGGGAGDITAVVAGEGLSGGGNAGTVTLDADLDLTKGLEFIVHGVDGSKIAIKPGANISFDTDGSLRADIASVSIKGTVDLTSATIPSPVTANDGYYNTVAGTLSAAWQAATGEGAITVYPGDTVVYNGTSWNYIPGSPGAVTSVFGRIGAVVATEGDYDIGELGDVDTTTAAPANGDVLQYDGTNWVPVDETVVAPVQSVHGRTGAVVSVEGDYDLDELGDVDLTSTPPTNGDVLEYNGSQWVPAAPTTAPVTSVFGRTGAVIAAEGDYDLDELGDVDLTSTPAVTNDVLQYNGSQWVPVDGASLGYWGRTGTVLSSANAGDSIQLTGSLDVNDQAINSTVTDGDIDLDANGAGLIKVTEFNLSQVPIVTQHDIGTAANEVPLNGYLGGMAFQDPASVSVDNLQVTNQITGNLAFASGNGIDFSADGNAAGMTSELLDDYEEGTWTPTMNYATAYGTQSGKYVKVGKTVHIWFEIQVTAWSATSASTAVGGIPFGNDGFTGCWGAIINGVSTDLDWRVGPYFASTGGIALWLKTSSGVRLTETTFSNYAALISNLGTAFTFRGGATFISTT